MIGTKLNIVFTVAVYASTVSFLGALNLPSAFAADTIQVQVVSTILRATPNPWGSKVADASYQDQLSIIEEPGSSTQRNPNQWIKVRTSRGKVGYVHVSAVTSRRVEIRGSAEAKEVSSSGSQVVLAGKGFSSRVENEYKRDNPNLNFALVDAVESFKPIENVQSFAKKGKLLG